MKNLLIVIVGLLVTASVVLSLISSHPDSPAAVVPGAATWEIPQRNMAILKVVDNDHFILMDPDAMELKFYRFLNHRLTEGQTYRFDGQAFIEIN